MSLKKDLLLVAVLQAGLEDNFAEVQVSVVECPDLTKEPFEFPVKGKSHAYSITTVYIFKTSTQYTVHVVGKSALQV